VPSEWRTCALGDVIELKRGYDLPSSERRPGSVPIVSSSGISGSHDEVKVKAPGVVTGRYGTIGQVFFVDEDFWPLNTTLYVRDFKGNDARFISYLLRSIDFQSFNDKSSVPGLNRNDLHRWEVAIPLPAEQRAIAGVLGALDDKIEQNRRTVRALDRLTRAIFSAWFVDFEPIKAKADGATSFPSIPQHVFDALPIRFVDSGVGPVPEGWEVKTIGALAERIAMGPFGSDIKAENFVAQGVPVIRGGNLTDGFVDEGYVYLTAAKADQLSNANAFPGDIVITHRGTLGQVGLIPRKSRHARYVVSQSQMLVRPRLEDLPPHFLYVFLTSTAGQHELLANRSQTGVPAISRPTTSVKAMRIVVPAKSLLGLFESTVASLFDCRVALATESRKLAELSGYLLPRLLNASARVEAPNG
jgi:type I restriction enzyme S subunit